MGTLTPPQHGCNYWLLLILLALTHSGSALRCWTCQSDTNPDCNDPFEAADQGPTTCVPDSTDKLKSGVIPVCTTARIEVNELESYVMRTCEWVSDSYPSFCQHHPQLPSHSRMVFCETCRHDGCNGAGVPNATSSNPSTASRWTPDAASTSNWAPVAPRWAVAAAGIFIVLLP